MENGTLVKRIGTKFWGLESRFYKANQRVFGHPMGLRVSCILGMLASVVAITSTILIDRNLSGIFYMSFFMIFYMGYYASHMGD